MEFRSYSILVSKDFQQSKIEPCLFFRDDCILCVYVDDIIIAAKSTQIIKVVQESLDQKYKLKHLGPLN